MKKIFVSIIFMFLAVAFGAMTGYNALCTGAYAGSTMPDSGDPDPDGGGSGGGPDDVDDGGGCGGGGGGGGGSDPDGSGGGVLF